MKRYARHAFLLQLFVDEFNAPQFEIRERATGKILSRTPATPARGRYGNCARLSDTIGNVNALRESFK